MLQRDYFIRLIEELMAALQRFLEKDKGRRTDDELRDLYRQYVGDYDDLRNLTPEEAIAYAREQWEPDRQQGRLEMLAELWYAEGNTKQPPLRHVLLEKAYRLFDFLDTHGSEYSIGRRQKMDMILGQLGHAVPSIIAHL